MVRDFFASGSKVLRVGIVAPVQGVDPYATMDYIGAVVAGQLFQTPFGFVKAGSEIRPVVFDERLRPQGEGRFIGSVRPDAKFSDGSAITATDVVASLQRAWAENRSVDVRGLDERTIALQFPREVDDPHAKLTPTSCAISKAGQGKVGSGAYLLTDDSSPTEIRMIRNPYYGGEQGRATIDEVRLTYFEPDANGHSRALLDALEAGEIDFTQVVSRDEAASLTQVRKLYQPGSSTAILFINTERVANPAVRRAIAASIDRYALTRLCYSNPAGFVARGLLPPRMGSFSDNVAPRIVDPAVFSRLKSLRLLVIWGPRPYLSKPTAVAEKIAAQLDEAGLKVELEFSDSAEDYFAKVDAADYDAVLTGWIADSGDPGDFLTSLVHSAYIRDHANPSAAASNLGRWRSRLADDLVEHIRAGGGRDRVAKLIELVGHEAPLIPLMYGPSVTIMSRRVRAFEPHPLNIYPLFSELELEG